MLARDRLGIKPLYYQILPDGIAFASELKALLVLGKPQIDPGSGARFPVSRLRPGTEDDLPRDREAARRAHARLAGRARAHRALLAAVDGRSSERRRRHAATQLDELLREVVPAHTLSDVPVGVFLSGGMDSALTTYYLDAPRTYTLGFDARDRSELEGARRAAAHLNTMHTEMTAQAARLLAGARCDAETLR